MPEFMCGNPDTDSKKQEKKVRKTIKKNLEKNIKNLSRFMEDELGQK